MSRAEIYRLLGSGEIEASKSGNKTMVIVTSLMAFVERNRVEVRSAKPTLWRRRVACSNVENAMPVAVRASGSQGERDALTAPTARWEGLSASRAVNR